MMRMVLFLVTANIYLLKTWNLGIPWQRSLTCQKFYLLWEHFPNWCRHPGNWHPKQQPVQRYKHLAINSLFDPFPHVDTIWCIMQLMTFPTIFTCLFINHILFKKKIQFLSLCFQSCRLQTCCMWERVILIILLFRMLQQFLLLLLSHT